MTSEYTTERQDRTEVLSHRDRNPRWRIQFLPANSDNLTLCTQKSVLDNLKQLRESFKQRLELLKPEELPADIQCEIPKIGVVVQRIERLVLGTYQREKLCELNSLVCSIEIALSSLFQKKLSKEFARQIRLDVEQQVIQYEHLPIVRSVVSQFVYVWHSPSTPLKVLYGLLWSFVIMFGGLSSLAILQYAIYNANTDVRNVQTSIDTKKKDLDSLQSRIQKIENSLLPRLVKQDHSASTNPETLAKLRNLRKEEEKTQLRIDGLEAKLEGIHESRNPIQKLLDNLLASGISESLSQLLWVAAAGTLGSIVSILIRVIDGFQDQVYRDRLTPFFIGFFKPVIGASFGVLFLTFMDSGIISTPLLSESSQTAVSSPSQTSTANSSDGKTMFLFAVAFVVGFSERLAKDTMNKLDGSSQESQKALNQESQKKLLDSLEEFVRISNQNSDNTKQLSNKSSEQEQSH